MQGTSKAALKAWEKLKRAELGARIAALRAQVAQEIKAKRRAAKEGTLCMPGAPKKKRASKPKSAAPKRAAPKKGKTRRAKRR